MRKRAAKYEETGWVLLPRFSDYFGHILHGVVLFDRITRQSGPYIPVVWCFCAVSGPRDMRKRAGRGIN